MLTPPPYPLFLNLVQRPVLVVGGGAVGLRKVKGLIECGARVTVVSPVFAAGFEAIADIERVEAPYAATHMARKLWTLVFAATDLREVNAQVQKHAHAAGIICCRADEPDEGDFSSGATVRVGATRKADGRGVHQVANAGGVQIAVSTAGASPVLASRICRQAAAGVDPVLPILADLLLDWRASIKQSIPDIRARRALFQRLAGEEMEKILRHEGAGGANRAFEQWFAESRQQAAASPAPADPRESASGQAQAKAPRPARVVKHAD